MKVCMAYDETRLSSAWPNIQIRNKMSYNKSNQFENKFSAVAVVKNLHCFLLDNEPYRP